MNGIGESAQGIWRCAMLIVECHQVLRADKRSKGRNYFVEGSSVARRVQLYFVAFSFTIMKMNGSALLNSEQLAHAKISAPRISATQG